MKTNEIVEALGKINTRLDAQDQMIQTGLARRHTGAVPAGVPAGPPGFRRGENTMTSRGFSYAKCMAIMGGCSGVSEEDATVEMDFCRRFTKSMVNAGYVMDRAANILVPIAPDLFSETLLSNDLYRECKALLHAGTANLDQEEYAWLQKKFSPEGKTAVTPAQSWLDQSVGGTWVGPASFGSPIELLRNSPTLLASSQIVPLGPTGRLTMPRMTKAIQGGWLGENTAQTPSQAGTSALNLVGKKAFAIAVLPGELLRFGSPAAEAMVRNDMMKTTFLVVDKGLLDGSGSTTQPLGIVTAALQAGNPHGFATVSLATANTISPQDIYKFPAAVEANNGVFTGWVMRPELFYALLETRVTPYSGAGAVGPFVFSGFRAMEDDMGTKRINGRKVITSAQVSNTRGNGTQSYVIGGQLEDEVVGMFGAIEMGQTDGGWTLFSADQCAVRTVATADGAPQHPGVWSVADAVNLTPGT